MPGFFRIMVDKVALGQVFLKVLWFGCLYQKKKSLRLETPKKERSFGYLGTLDRKVFPVLKVLISLDI